MNHYSVGVGASSQIVPLYLSEVSPPGLRGTVNGIRRVAYVIGCLVAFQFAVPLQEAATPALPSAAPEEVTSMGGRSAAVGSGSGFGGIVSGGGVGSGGGNGLEKAASTPATATPSAATATPSSAMDSIAGSATAPAAGSVTAKAKTTAKAVVKVAPDVNVAAAAVGSAGGGNSGAAAAPAVKSAAAKDATVAVASVKEDGTGAVRGGAAAGVAAGGGRARLRERGSRVALCMLRVDSVSNSPTFELLGLSPSYSVVL